MRKNINLSFLEKLNQELQYYDVNKIDYLEIREEENLQLTEKKTKARLGSKMARKAKKTKRFNPASKRVRALNKQ